MSPTTSSPIPAPINTRTRADSNSSTAMNSPSSLNSGFSLPLSSPLSLVFTEGSQTSEEPLETIQSVASPVMAKREAPKPTRPQLYQTAAGPPPQRKSSESMESLGRTPSFNSFGRGRHSNVWLFRGVSIRGAVRGLWDPSSKN